LLVLGIGVLVGMALIKRGIPFPAVQPYVAWEIYCMGVAGIAALPGLLLLLRGRRQFCAWRVSARTTMAAMLIAFVVIECVCAYYFDT